MEEGARSHGRTGSQDARDSTRETSQNEARADSTASFDLSLSDHNDDIRVRYEADGPFSRPHWILNDSNLPKFDLFRGLRILETKKESPESNIEPLTNNATSEHAAARHGSLKSNVDIGVANPGENHTEIITDMPAPSDETVRSNRLGRAAVHRTGLSRPPINMSVDASSEAVRLAHARDDATENADTVAQALANRSQGGAKRKPPSYVAFVDENVKGGEEGLKENEKMHGTSTAKHGEKAPPSSLTDAISDSQNSVSMTIGDTGKALERKSGVDTRSESSKSPHAKAAADVTTEVS